MKLQKRILTFAAAAMLALSMALSPVRQRERHGQPSAHRPDHFHAGWSSSW